MLLPHLLVLLRAWWKLARPQGWLFPGHGTMNDSSAPTPVIRRVGVTGPKQTFPRTC